MDLSKISGINRITIIHHLKRLEGAGFVQRKEGKYVMRVQSAEGMLMEFRKDMERTFAEMDELAREIDGQFEAMERISATAFERPLFASGKKGPIFRSGEKEGRSKQMERQMLEQHKRRRLP